MTVIAVALLAVMPLAVVGRVSGASVPPVNARASAILNALALHDTADLITGTVTSDPGVYIQVEPAVITMGPAPAVGQTFVVDVKLYNATTANVPAGVAGIEVHLHWNNTLIQPVSFQDKLGTPGGVLATGLVLYALLGFYDDALNPISGPDYSQATQYAVAAASTVGGWWGNGMVVEITFKVVYQPVTSAASCGLDLTYTDLIDWNVAEIAHSSFNGTYTILPTQVLGWACVKTDHGGVSGCATLGFLTSCPIIDPAVPTDYIELEVHGQSFWWQINMASVKFDKNVMTLCASPVCPYSAPASITAVVYEKAPYCVSAFGCGVSFIGGA